MVQGKARPLGLRLRAVTGLALAFCVSATAVFAGLHGLGYLLGLHSVAQGPRVAMAAVVLLACIAMDVVALRRRSYCPVTWRRQTPRKLQQTLTIPSFALVWGLDTGLVFTTFRVAAVSWAAMALSLLCLAPWWSGMVYGLAFVVPLLALFLFKDLTGNSEATPNTGLETLLERRPQLQILSAGLLLLSGIALLLT